MVLCSELSTGVAVLQTCRLKWSFLLLKPFVFLDCEYEPQQEFYQECCHRHREQRGEVMGKPKKNSKNWIICGVQRIQLRQTVRLYPGKYLSSPKTYVPSGCCLTVDIRSSMQHESCTAFIKPFLFFFFNGSRWWNTYTHVHWRSCCSTLRSHLASSLNFSCFSLPIFTHLIPASSCPKSALESGFYLDLNSLERGHYYTNVAQNPP